ncbi:MAG: DUF192 domain-containing protein [Firmicutes bacterium]|jgi:uncharacterized membrane protein (UPF0127 family)|nr:DUF192 domain-containing protein [Bacillota bacterium]
MFVRRKKEIIFTGRAAPAFTFWKRFKGLMLKKTFPHEYDALFLAPCKAIHTFFMRFAIDVVFLNKKNEIVALYPSLAPWRVTPPCREAEAALEFAGGTIDKFSLACGDLLHWRAEKKGGKEEV